MEELMMRIRFPVRRLASTRDDDASAIQWAVWPDGDASGQVHHSRDGAQDASAVIDEADELADAGLFSQINNATQGGMMVAFRSDLREDDATFEMIDNSLPALGGPPFYRDVVLSACGDYPIRNIGTDNLCDLRRPRPFDGVKMDVALEQARADLQAELVGEVLRKAVDAVPRAGVALVEQRIVALDDAAFIFPNRLDIRAVQPKVIERRAQVREEPPRIGRVKFTDSGGEKCDVAEGIPAAEDEFFPPFVGMGNENDRLFTPW